MRRIFGLAISLLVVGSLSSVAAAPADDGNTTFSFRGFADPRGTGMTDSLRARLQQALPNDLINVIVTYDEDAGDSFLARGFVGNFQVKHDFRSISGFSGTVSAAQAESLSLMPGVFRVEEDIEVSITLDAANSDFGAEYARIDFSVDGSGVTACIIDTGIDPGHEQLDDPGKIVGGHDFVNNDGNPNDDHGHGTHVANILAGAGTGGSNAFKYRGVAPGASLLSMKVLNSAGSGSASNIVAGIEECVNLGADIISMSLGGSPTDGFDAMSQAANAAVDAGVAVVISAGNSGDGHETIGTPGAAAKVITVGAVTDYRATEGVHLAPWSSRGPNLAGVTKPDTVAPGVLIAAARAGTTSGYVLFSGTSMSAPYVAGAVALMLELNPGLTPVQVKSLIHTWSQDWGVAGIDNDYGAGLIDVYALVGAAAGVTPEPTVFPVHQFMTGSVPDDGQWTFDFEIGDDALDIPIAATVLIEGRPVCSGWWRCSWNWDPDLEAELRDPNGNRLDLSECLAGSECGDYGHQETLHAMPTSAGTYTLRVFPYSGSPNNGDGGNFTVDLSAGPLLLALGPADDPPSAGITAPANNGTVTGNVMVQVQANDTEDGEGSLDVEVKIGAGAWQAAVWNGGTNRYEWNWNTGSGGDGDYAIAARAGDSGANTTNATTLNVSVDNIDEAPSASITAPANNETVSGTVTIQVQADDAEDAPGALNVEVAIDGGTWQAAAWNAGTSRYEWSWITPPADDGAPHTITARATDTGATTTDAAAINVTVDNVDVAPTASITAPANNATVSGNVLIQVQANDVEDAAGTLNVEVRIDGGAWQAAAWNAGTNRYEWTWNTPGGDDGVGHAISARANDSGANETNAATINVTVDNVDAEPTASLTSPANNATVSGNVLIQVQANDVEDAAGTLTVQVRIDGGSWQTASWNAGTSRYERNWNSTGVGDGNHTIAARAGDTGGHTTNASSINVSVDNVDDPPSAGITSPANNATVAGSVLIQVQANDVEDTTGTLNVEVRIDGGGWQTAGWNGGTSRYEWNWNTPGGDNSVGHTIAARATDVAANTTNASSINVTVDNVDDPPSVATTSPANNANLSGSVTVRVQANDVEDAAGTLNVDVAIDGAWQNASWNGGTNRYEYTWNTPGADDGAAHTIAARATDSNLATTTTGNLNVTVDNIDAAPLVSIVNPGGPLLGMVTLQVQASDVEDGAGALDVEIAVDGAWQNASWNGATSRYELLWDTTGAANGGHTIDARATDSAFNTTNATQLGVSVDNPLVATVHSGDLDGTSTRDGWSRWSATVTIYVHSGGHVPVAGANVFGSWSQGSSSGACTTGAGGSCTVTSGSISRWRARSVTYTLSDIVGSTYDSGGNHDGESDSNGTAITLSRP